MLCENTYLPVDARVETFGIDDGLQGKFEDCVEGQDVRVTITFVTQKVIDSYYGGDDMYEQYLKDTGLKD